MAPAQVDCKCADKKNLRVWQQLNQSTANQTLRFYREGKLDELALHIHLQHQAPRIFEQALDLGEELRAFSAIGHAMVAG